MFKNIAFHKKATGTFGDSDREKAETDKIYALY